MCAQRNVANSTIETRLSAEPFPKESFPACKKGDEEAVLNGIIGGYPVDDLEVVSSTEAITMWIPTNSRSRWPRFSR
jgi:hypothetical protein